MSDTLEIIELNDEIVEKDKEIERLQRQKEELQVNGLRQETLFKLEIERLNNIIKEVREWANKTIFYFDFEEEINEHAFDLLYTKQGQELLEILDKGE